MSESNHGDNVLELEQEVLRIVPTDATINRYIDPELKQNAFIIIVRGDETQKSEQNIGDENILKWDEEKKIKLMQPYPGKQTVVYIDIMAEEEDAVDGWASDIPPQFEVEYACKFARQKASGHKFADCVKVTRFFQRPGDHLGTMYLVT